MPRFWIVGSVAASLFGLWTSLTYCFAAWFINGDAANAAMLWQGVRKHGWVFLQSFGYTQDNWLLSLILPEFLVFKLIGPSPTFVVASGWLIFVGCVVMTLLIARSLGGNRVAVALAPVLLLTSQGAIAVPGSYAHPVTHNISLLLGLFAVYSAFQWLAERKPAWLLLGMVALFVAAISDPWTNAAFSLPMFAASLGLAAMPSARPARSTALILAAALLLATVLAITKVFGLLGFLPGATLAFVSPMVVLLHIRLLASIITDLFAIAPGYHQGIDVGEPHVIIVLVTCGLLAVMLVPVIVSWVRAFTQVPLATRFVACVAVGSMAATIGAFCLTDFSTGLFAGRFVMNVGFFLPLLTATAMALFGQTWRRSIKGLILAFAALLMVTGIASNIPGWQHGRIHADVVPFKQVAQFLADHGLKYGFGSYWGSNATAVTWVADEHVIMRPVTIDPQTGTVTPRPWQASPFWFQPDDWPPGQDQTFLMLDHDCPQPDTCVTGISKQFGAPEQVLHFQDKIILVWPHKLTL